jgi:hypothetical protein
MQQRRCGVVLSRLWLVQTSRRGCRDGLDSAQGVQGQSKACLGQCGPGYLGSVLSLLGGVCRVGPSFGSDALRRCIDPGWHVPKRDSLCLLLWAHNHGGCHLHHAGAPPATQRPSTPFPAKTTAKWCMSHLASPPPENARTAATGHVHL